MRRGRGAVAAGGKGGQKLEICLYGRILLECERSDPRERKKKKKSCYTCHKKREMKKGYMIEKVWKWASHRTRRGGEGCGRGEITVLKKRMDQPSRIAVKVS